MSKRNYTHIKELLPEIQTMIATGMTQREIAETLKVLLIYGIILLIR